MEKKVYDLIARRFIAVFFPDCKIATTTVLGDVNNVAFKATGKEILVPGWRTVFEKKAMRQKKMITKTAFYHNLPKVKAAPMSLL